MPKFYTLKEVAIIFRVSVRTLRRWIQEDKKFNRKVLKKITKGKYLIPEDEVKRLSEKFNI